jgi:hypothetical protein
LRHISCGLALLAALAAGPAAASDYSFLDLGAVDEARPAGVSGRGPFLAGSLALPGRLFLFGEYQDEYSGGLALHDYAAGLGAHWALDGHIDLSAAAGWAAEAAPQKTDRGWLANLSLRWTLTDRLELEPGIWRTAPGRGVNQLYADLRYRFAEKWAMGLGFARGDGDRLWRVYLRLYL